MRTKLGLLLLVPLLLQAPAQSFVRAAGLPSPAIASAKGEAEVGVPSAQEAAASGKTVLHSSTNLVVVDVVVTDHGKAVHGLDRGRFHIYEDGHEQNVVSFDETQPGTTRPMPAKATPLPPNVYSNVPKYPPGPALNVLLLDNLNTPNDVQADVHRQLLQYTAHMKPGTPLAIFGLNARLQLLSGFTSDPVELTAVLEGKKAASRASVAMDTGLSSQILKGADHAAASGRGGGGADLTSMAMQTSADVSATQIGQQVRLTLEGMRELALYLSAIPGRKNVIWFSGGFPLEIQPDGSLPNATKNEADFQPEIREVSRLLAVARVAVYPVYAGGPTSLPSMQASYDFGDHRIAGTPGYADLDAQGMDQTRGSQDSMRKFAELTGGRYVATNDVKEAMADAIENGASYYTIGYAPLSKQYNGQFRNIKVRLDHASYTLAYRHGYFAETPGAVSAHSPQKASTVRASTMQGAPPASQVQFQARILPATSPALRQTRMPEGPAGELTASLKGPVQRYIVDLAVDPHTLTFEELPNGGHQASLEYIVVAYDPDGKRLNYLDRGIQLTYKPEEFQRAMAGYVMHRFALDLPEGPCALRVAVFDPATARIGSVEVPVMVSEP